MTIYWNNSFNPRLESWYGLGNVITFTTLGAAGAAAPTGGSPLLAILGVG